jgi:hypothetical protein
LYAYVDASLARDVVTRKYATDYVVQEVNGVMKERHFLIVLYVVQISKYAEILKWNIS